MNNVCQDHDTVIITRQNLENRSSNFNGLMLAKQRELKKQQEIIEKAKKEQGGGKEEIIPKESRLVIPAEKKESLFTRAPEDISQEDAIVRFRRLKEEDKNRRQRQELKNEF